MILVITRPSSQLYSNFRMADDQDYILDCEYNLGEDDLLGQSDQEEEPMDTEDSILEEGEDLLVSAEQEEPGLFGCGDRDIFQEYPPPAPASPLYGLSQLIRDVNSSPTQKDPEVPACSREELVKECVKTFPNQTPISTEQSR